MRGITLLAALLACIAFGAEPTTINLDRPGVLELLKQDHPRRYQAVIAVLRASQTMPCESSELKTLQTRLDVRELECGVMLLTSYPAKRHVSFQFDSTSYAATVVLKDATTVQPARSMQPAELKH